MAALGLDADVGKILGLGWKPLLLACILWVNLLVSGFVVDYFLVGDVHGG